MKQSGSRMLQISNGYKSDIIDTSRSRMIQPSESMEEKSSTERMLADIPSIKPRNPKTAEMTSTIFTARKLS